MLDSLYFLSIENVNGLVMSYGPIGLLLSSTLASTIFFPFIIELVFIPLMKAGMSGLQVVFYASLGAVIGTYINYLIGYYGIKIAHKSESRGIIKAKEYADKYGFYGVFILFAWPIPLPVDPLAIVLGVTRMDWKKFLITVFIAKIVRYSIAVGLFSLI